MGKTGIICRDASLNDTKPTRNRLYRDILSLMADGKKRTAREIDVALGRRNRSFPSLRPRITELTNQGRLYEYGTAYDSQTERRVTLYGLPEVENGKR